MCYPGTIFENDMRFIRIPILTKWLFVEKALSSGHSIVYCHKLHLSGLHVARIAYGLSNCRQKVTKAI